MAKSLQDITAAKVLESLQGDKDAIHTYVSLPDDVHQVLFPHLWQDHLRLLDVERHLESCKGLTPAADRHICFNHCALNQDMDIDKVNAGGNEDGDVQPEQDIDTADVGDANRAAAIGTTQTPYAHRDYFRAKWRQRIPADRVHSFANPTNCCVWDEAQLAATGDAQKPIGFHAGWKERPRRVYPVVRLADFISSQLLLHRLTIVFGMPLSSTDIDEKTCWTMELTPDDTSRSLFVVEDYLGGVSIYFHGTEKAGLGAIELLNWLVGKEVPHSFPARRPFLAGTEAPESVRLKFRI